MAGPTYEIRQGSSPTIYELFQDGSRVYSGTQQSVIQMAKDRKNLAVQPPKPVVPPPVVSPVKSPDGAVSSSDVSMGQSQTQATSAAASAIGQNQTPAWAQQLLDQNNQRLASGEKALKLSFDAALASNNQQYNSLFGELSKNHANAKQAGVALAAQLNPYSSERISSTTGGYLQSIDDKYEGQARKLQEQMNVAQQQLQAGFYEKYTQLVNDAQKENQKFVMDMQQFQLQQQKAVQDQVNADRSASLTKRGQDISMQGQVSDDFRALLTTLSGSPELQRDISEYQSTGKINAGLMPIIEKGMQAGMSPDESISIFQYQSDSVRKQQALEDYRSQQLVNAQERIAIASTNANVKIATMQMVQNAGAQAMSEGKKPGTLEYAESIANATAGSKMSLPAGEVDKYTNLGILSSQLGSLKTRIAAVDKGSALGNIILSRTPRDVQSMSNEDLTILNNQVQALSGILGKSVFGESGNLSNTDIQRVLGALPSGGTTAQVREALYKNIVGLLAEKSVLTLQNQAANGYSVAGYAPIVRQISEKATELTGSSVGPETTAGFNYEAWKKENGL